MYSPNGTRCSLVVNVANDLPDVAETAANRLFQIARGIVRCRRAGARQSGDHKTPPCGTIAAESGGEPVARRLQAWRKVKAISDQMTMGYVGRSPTLRLSKSPSVRRKCLLAKVRSAISNAARYCRLDQAQQRDARPPRSPLPLAGAVDPDAQEPPPATASPARIERCCEPVTAHPADVRALVGSGRALPAPPRRRPSPG